MIHSLASSRIVVSFKIELLRWHQAGSKVRRASALQQHLQLQLSCVPCEMHFCVLPRLAATALLLPMMTKAAAVALLPARFVEYAEDRSTRESQRFWFSVMDADGDGRLSWADMKLLYDAVEKSCNAGILLHFEDLMNQIRDMVSQQRNPADGFTAQELWDSKLGAGVIGLLTNANNMLLQRSTAEWGRGKAGCSGPGPGL